ncbi:hypothetical protein FRB90_001373 [Tulasnella sp. 427]|nr:hypothetical protein FRB90_001373 [Tulasnella sp. 427]
MDSVIQDYLSTSVDITYVSMRELDKMETFQVLNQIFAPKIIVWWQPRGDLKIHYLAVFETADAARRALFLRHNDWEVAVLSDPAKRALSDSLGETIKRYPNTFRRARGEKVSSEGVIGQGHTAEEYQQNIQTTGSHTSEQQPPNITAASSSLPTPPATATFPASRIEQSRGSDNTVTNTIDAVADQASAVDRAIRALASQKDKIFEQKTEVEARNRVLEHALNAAHSEIDNLRDLVTRREKENENLVAIISSTPPKPVTREACVETSPMALPPTVINELKQLCLAVEARDMALAEKENALQELSRALEEEVAKRKAAEKDRDATIAARNLEQARIPAVIELYKELERLAMESMRRSENGNEVV